MDISEFFSIAYRNCLTQMAASPSFQFFFFFFPFLFLVICAKLNAVLTTVLNKINERLGLPCDSQVAQPHSSEAISRVQYLAKLTYGFETALN